MSKTLVEYQLEGGTTVLIEGEHEDGGVVKASRDRGGNVVMRANQNLKAAMSNVRLFAKEILSEVETLHVDEAEITLGLSTAGETGILAISKGTADANFTITLKWKKGGKNDQQ